MLMRQRMTLVKALAMAWVLSYTGLVYAYVTLSQEMRGTFDYESLGWGAAIGAGAGIARTILWLASEKSVVIHFWGQLWRDVIVALIGGAFAYVLVTYLATIWPQVFIKELRFIVILVVGASKGRWQNAVFDLVGILMVRVSRIVSGAEPVPVVVHEPTTITLPLSSDK